MKNVKTKVVIFNDKLHLGGTQVNKALIGKGLDDRTMMTSYQDVQSNHREQTRDV
ncbi:hypothetical protein AlacWU_05902 [Aspergillus niger]|nr:hypothetical protein AlacWU_05902 [Aspergillus niger]